MTPPKIKSISPDRVLVYPDPPEDVTEAGIIIPDQAKTRHTEGTVVFVGIGTPDEPMQYSVGDKVVYGLRSGLDTTIDGVEYVIVRQGDILYSK